MKTHVIRQELTEVDNIFCGRLDRELNELATAGNLPIKKEYKINDAFKIIVIVETVTQFELSQLQRP